MPQDAQSAQKQRDYIAAMLKTCDLPDLAYFRWGVGFYSTIAKSAVGALRLLSYYQPTPGCVDLGSGNSFRNIFSRPTQSFPFSCPSQASGLNQLAKPSAARAQADF